ncbi:MAG: anthranilate phosphoribosyltransferase [Akkermansiaceae bacterium]
MDTLSKHLQAGKELSEREVYVAVEMLLDESICNDKKGDFLRSLTEKGETATEITYFVQACLERAVDPEVGKMEFDGPTIDVCGTGGDKLDLFNVSTTSMFVIAAGGAVVVKHGNRGITSKSGGADVLEALGVKLEISQEKFRECLSEAGVGFMYAPAYHPAFKVIAPVRKKLADEGIRTIFNLIGPLLNPAKPECQLVGICNEGLAQVYADILQRLGRDSAWVVLGKTAEGATVDELSLMGESHIYKSGAYQDLVDETVLPADLGLDQCEVADLVGGDAELNAQILTDILSGKERGPKRQMVLLNAGAGLACAGLVDSLADGVKKAGELIDDGLALDRLHKLQQVAK